MNQKKTEKLDQVTSMFHALSTATEPTQAKCDTPEPPLSEKKKFSVFLREIFPSFSPKTVSQLSDMKKYFKEDDIREAITYYYRSRDEPPDIENWVGQRGFEQLKYTIQSMKIVEKAKAFNAQAKNEKQMPQARVFSEPDKYCRREIDSFWEKIKNFKEN